MASASAAVASTTTIPESPAVVLSAPPVASTIEGPLSGEGDPASIVEGLPVSTAGAPESTVVELAAPGPPAQATRRTMGRKG
jgi:hypothetical protein